MKRLALLFARRYLFARKSHSVINLISGVSAFAVGVPVAAMVILLSVFNGFEQLVRNMYGDFDPDILVTARSGKVFRTDSLPRTLLLNTEGVQEVSMILEDNALLEYRGRQYIGTLRGVDSLYRHVVPIDSMVVAGQYQPLFGDIEQALVGQGIAYNLGVRTALLDPIRAYVPRRGSFSTLIPLNSYREERILPSGIFMLDAETDSKYVIVPFSFAQRLFDYEGYASGAMVKVRPGADPDKVRTVLSARLGDDFKVQTRYQQKASLYRIMTYEKWGIFFIILLVMVIASFSIIGSLAMLIIDKRRDVRTLFNLGGSIRFVRGIFLREGMLISMLGAAGGMIFGLALCWVQMQFGVIRIPAETFLVDSYPVVVQWPDLLGIAVAVIAVNYIITKFTVVKMIPKSDLSL